jgi:8-hydroxy-5-deazaflavin:NADPH oxidoreductase
MHSGCSAATRTGWRSPPGTRGVIAGDDADAKARVSSFTESLALRPLDAGDLKMARWPEGAGLLIVGQAARNQNFSLSIKILG